MDPNEITSLASLLRNNGDKVLNSEFKLTLTGPLLRALNDSFTLIADPNETSPGFQVVKPNNAKSDVFRDLQLIYDFVQKTLYLCLAHYKIDDEHFDGPIHIQKFRSLETLEIQKVNIKQISGIQSLRSQLKNIICIRSLSNLDDIITHCGSDNCNGFVWSQLKTANFSYNNLKTVHTSLEFAPNLNNLNLSHNQLTSAEAIKWLPNLKILNLSFNRLTNIPMFHSESTRRLQVLNMSNNFIEDLCGISRLDALNELDLSENCFLDHTYLLPLSTLRSLRYINLFGNPLFCHPKHREATSYYLNKSVIQNQFILDFEPLSKFEKSRTGRYQSFNTALTSRFTTARQSSSLSTPTSSNRHSQANTPASSVGSVKSINIVPSQEVVEKVKDKIKKPPKARTVEIGEKTTPLETKDHLETMKEIQDLREKYGEDWLKSKNVQTVKSIVPSQNSETSRVTSKELIDSILNSMNIERESKTNVPLPGTSTPIILENSPSSVANIKDEDTSILDATTDYESFVSETTQDESTVYKSANESGPNVDAIYQRKESVQEEVISEPEDSEITYIVTEQNKPEDQLFLTLSDNAIKEKDSLTRRTLTKWSLTILQSCDRIKSNTLRINFDTVKKDKKERIYTVEEGLCRELEKYLRDILSKRELSDMNQIIYKCVACACKFSREKSYSYRGQNLNVVCPECGSKFVAEVNEAKPSNDTAKPVNTNKSSNKAITKLIAEEKKHITQQQDNVSQDQEQQVPTNNNNSGEKILNIEQSASQSSIGSAGSLNESSSCSKLSQNSQNSFDSNQSVAGSSTNDRDADFNTTTTTTHGSRHFQSRYDGRDSDVEIISNPSESSIEVLDGSNYNQSRKTSEERRISRIPSLETIKDNSINSLVYHLSDDKDVDDRRSNVINATNEFLAEEKGSNSTLTDKKTAFDINKILTESSSSGSATDTYEQASDDSANSKSTISTVLGGLLQSTNILLSRSQKSADALSQCDKYKFNYNDFGDIDHRLKFYMYQTKFDTNEHFKWLVKGKIFNDTSQNWIDGIVIMSTLKIYLMHIFGPENDDITKWLKVVHSGSIVSIESIQLLPFKVGLSFEIKGYTRFSLILQDILRTDSLLLFFANNPLPTELNHQVSESVLKRLSSTANNEQIKMFSILNSCEISCDDTVTKKIDVIGFFTTDSNLYLTTSNLSWLTETNSNTTANTELIDLYLVQMISNLVGVEKLTDDLVELNFLDETENNTELWKCKFETKENADSSLNAISQSWEKLFSVPLINN